MFLSDSKLLNLGLKIIENRPYGVHVEREKAEDCTLRLDSVSGPFDVGNFSLVNTGAWLTDAATNSTEIYVLQKGAQNKEVLMFNSTEALNKDVIANKYQLPFPWTGTGHVVYGGALYFIKYNSATVIRYNFFDIFTVVFRLHYNCILVTLQLHYHSSLITVVLQVRIRRSPNEKTKGPSPCRSR